MAGELGSLVGQSFDGLQKLDLLAGLGSGGFRGELGGVFEGLISSFDLGVRVIAPEPAGMNWAGRERGHDQAHCKYPESRPKEPEKRQGNEPAEPEHKPKQAGQKHHEERGHVGLRE